MDAELLLTEKITFEAWTEGERSLLLKRLLPLLSLALLVGCISLFLAYRETPDRWQHVAMGIVLLTGLITFGLAIYLNRRGYPGYSASLIVLALSSIGLINAALYRDMVTVYVMITLFNTLLTSLMISPRVSGLYAVGSVLAGFLIHTAQTFAGDAALPLVGVLRISKFVADVCITVGTLALLVYVVSASRRSTERALRRLLTLSKQCQRTNIQLELEMKHRELMEQERIQTAVEQERVKTLSEFITSAGHEFRTPLSTINAQLFLLRGMRLDEAAQDRLGVVRQQAESIQVLVEAMLMMARLDGDPRLSLEAGALNSTVLAAITRLEKRAEEQAVHLSVELTDDLPALRHDPAHLSLAMENVLRNAIEFSPAGGQVIVWTGQMMAHQVVRISDTGPGIDAEQMPFIFDRFYRGEPARTTRGAGLGLSIARKIIALHGGQITVESSHGMGTTVEISLPASGEVAFNLSQSGSVLYA